MSHLNGIFQSSKIKDLFKENNAVDYIFKKKMQKIYFKHQNSQNFQFTNSNIYNNHSNKIHFETSLKNNGKSLYSNNISNSKMIKSSISSLEEDENKISNKKSKTISPKKKKKNNKENKESLSQSGEKNINKKYSFLKSNYKDNK